MGNDFFVIERPSRKDGGPSTYWTGTGWSAAMDDAVLFRHAGFAVEFARKRRWRLDNVHLRVRPVFARIPYPAVKFS